MILIYTHRLPLSAGDIFLKNELDYLKDELVNIHVYAINGKDEIDSELGSGIKQVQVNRAKLSPLKFLLLFIRFFDWNLIPKNRNEVSTIKNLFEKFYELLEFLPNGKPVLHYTYWFDDGVIISGLLKKMRPSDKIVSRAHGFDVYTERREGDRIPFRKFHLNAINKVYSVSKAGCNYLKEKYPEYIKKMGVARLGVQSLKLSPISNNPDYIHIVSISNLVEVKRVHLIVALLKVIEKPVYWTHFGDGDLRSAIQDEINSLPNYHKVELKGFTKNRDILSYLSSNEIDMVVNVSSSEGVPVSLMEAISCGIPVLATDVGGSNEVVTQQSGCLLPEEFNVKTWKAQFFKVFEQYSRNQHRREEVKQFFEQNFNAKKHYSEWSNLLKEFSDEY